MVTPLLTDADRRRIEVAIEGVEQRSAIELVVAVVERSGDYWHGRVLLAAGAALSAALMVLRALGLGSPHAALWAILAEIPAGLLVYQLAKREAWARRFVPVGAAEHAVRTRAFQLFSERGLHHTRDHTGLLILVSALERRVVILGDSALHTLVGDDGWQDRVAELVAQVRAGRTADGILEAIARIEAQVAKGLPVRPDDTNELPNTVIQE
jgi:putative membrane protein